MISYFRDDRLCGTDSFLSVVKPDYTECPMIAAVGAGGKTSTLRRLAEEYALMGKKAIVLTTTHMREETTPWSCVVEEEEWISKGNELLERVKECLEQYGQAWIGTKAKKGKMSSVPELILAEIESWNVPLLVEADGARMLPLKVPGEQEPVLLPQTTHVFSVYGMDALDQKLEEICFRSEKAAELLGKQPEDQVTEEDIIKLACHEQGGRKGCPKQAEYIVVLNKADTKELQERACKIAKCLHENGIKNIFVTSYML